jgi:uncharacterized metal-binding protein (TIGR02443 family)
MVDAEGRHEGTPCPHCGDQHTITYRYAEGFSELECPECGYRSDQQELDTLQRFSGDLLEGETLPPVPRRPLEA